MEEEFEKAWGHVVGIRSTFNLKVAHRFIEGDW